MASCPCGSGTAFPDCCRPYLKGESDAPTAEALMRSRYCAYVRRDESYLMRTWDPSSRPESLDLEDVTWLGLDVLETAKGGAHDAWGKVSFAAHFAGDGIEPGTMREVSRFSRNEDGNWVYLDGETSSY